MYRGSGPRIVPLIVAVLVIAFVIAGLVMVGRMVFSGDKQSNGDKKNGPTLVDSVLNQDESRSVRWTIRGPIVANEKFKSYQITVSPSERTFVTYSGYLDDVIDTKKYSNNKQAYEQFVYALNNANITATHAAKDADFRGVCATEGIAYMFETLNNRSADQSIWSTSCRDSKGTMAADPLKIHALFVNQIPEFKLQFNEIY